MTSRRNPLPPASRPKRTTTSNEPYHIYWAYRNVVTRELWVFALIVLTRFALYWTKVSVDRLDFLEYVLNHAENWAVNGDKNSASALADCIVEAREAVDEILKKCLDKFGKSSWPPYEQVNFSFCCIAYELCKETTELYVQDDGTIVELYGGTIWAGFRHLASILYHSESFDVSPLRYFEKKARNSNAQSEQLIGLVLKEILTNRKFPSELFIGVDPERTSILIEEMVARKLKKI